MASYCVADLNSLLCSRADCDLQLIFTHVCIDISFLNVMCGVILPGNNHLEELVETVI